MVAVVRSLAPTVMKERTIRYAGVDGRRRWARWREVIVRRLAAQQCGTEVASAATAGGRKDALAVCVTIPYFLPAVISYVRPRSPRCRRCVLLSVPALVFVLVRVRWRRRSLSQHCGRTRFSHRITCERFTCVVFTSIAREYT